MSPKPYATATRQVGTRLTLDTVNRVDALRDEFPGADGKRATRASVLRGLVEEALEARARAKRPTKAK